MSGWLFLLGLLLGVVLTSALWAWATHKPPPQADPVDPRVVDATLSLRERLAPSGERMAAGLLRTGWRIGLEQSGRQVTVEAVATFAESEQLRHLAAVNGSAIARMVARAYAGGITDLHAALKTESEIDRETLALAVDAALRKAVEDASLVVGQ